MPLVASTLPTQRAITTIAAQNLTGQTLVGDQGGYSRITGDVAPSSLRDGDIYVETEHGSLYFEVDEQVTVVDDSHTPTRNEMITVARSLDAHDIADGTHPEYRRGIVELITYATCNDHEDIDTVRRQVEAALTAPNPA